MDPLAGALGRIPSGLFVLTANGPSGPVGMLASWVMQAAFDPPMVTAALAQDRGLLDLLKPDIWCGVNILPAEAKRLIIRFGKPEKEGYNPFKNLGLVEEESRAPILADSLAWLVGQVQSSVVAGDHRVALLRVERGGVLHSGDPKVHLRKNGMRY